MNKDKRVKELEEEIVGHKQIIEQLETEINHKEIFIMEMFPVVNDIKIKQGWHGAGTVTHRVEIDVCSDDLHKLVKLLTHNGLNRKAYSQIRRKIEDEIKADLENKKS